MAHPKLSVWARAAAVLVASVTSSGCSTDETIAPLDSSGEGVASFALSSDLKYARVDIDKLAANEREGLKNRPGIQRWIELDRQLLVLASPAVIDGLKAEYKVITLDVTPRPENLCLIHQTQNQPETPTGGTVLARASRLAVLQADSGGCSAVAAKTRSARVRPLTGNEVVARQLASTRTKSGTAQSLHTRDVVNALDMNRWSQNVETLTSFDRFALRETSIGQAKEWIAGEFCAIAQAPLAPEAPAGSVGVRCQKGNMDVRTQPFPLSPVEGRNVVLTLKGFRADGPVFVVGAHYDALASEPGATQAPGAEDNASGTAAVIEMARAIARYPTDATFVFVAFSGEEQGMVGSEYYVQQLAGTALAARIRSVVIMDMIGYSGDTDLDVMLETADTLENQALLAHLSSMAATYAPELTISTSTYYWGSDHEPFLDAGYSGLLTIENDYETYPYYHSIQDTYANQNERFTTMAGAIIRMNTAALAEWSIPDAFLAALMCVIQN